MSALVSVRKPTAMNENNSNINGNNAAPVRSFGITPSISSKYPDPMDYVATKNLEDTLISYDYFESSEELAHRLQVLGKLNTLVRQWIRTVSLAKNVPSEIAESVGGRVYTFGSYRLGVHSKGKEKTRSILT
jgi:poly(A) polymerase